MFGPFTVLVEGQPLPNLRTRKGQWLLALAALRPGREWDRARLAGTLWPESEESQALFNLRQSLSDLRRALGAQAFRLHSPSKLTLLLDLSGADCDVSAFDAAVAQGDIASLEQAVGLYRGPLLEDCTAEWVLLERETREQAYLAALEALAAAAAERNDVDAAARFLRQVTALDPARESAQRRLMETLAAKGDYAAAVQTYRLFRRYLHHELHTEPSAETVAVFQGLRAEGSRRAKRQAVLLPSCAPASGLLPQPLTPLIGRQDEVQEVIACFDTARLVTLTGFGGIGKTRLAIQAAEESTPGYADGVRFVDLSPLTAPSHIPQAIASALGIREEAARPLLESLVVFLQSRQFLLILDNCEHLIEACAPIAEALLRNSPQLHILATSRQSLGLPGERIWRVRPLALPPLSEQPSEEKDLVSVCMECAAVRLFVERAAWSQAGFRLSAANVKTVLQICRQLDGIPLALELAAAQVQGLPLEQIASRLGDRFQSLGMHSRTILSRQQTLEATLDWSVHLLSRAEQTLLSRLAVFAGGWELEAAEAVCSDFGFSISDFRLPNTSGPASIQNPKSKIQNDAVPELLVSLVDKSLVTYESSEQRARYNLPEIIRQYCGDKLGERREEEIRRERHCAYFLALAEQADSRLSGTDYVKWLHRLDQEQENLRAALRWTLETNKAVLGLRLAGALGRFWSLRGYAEEGHRQLMSCLDLWDCSDYADVQASAWAAGRTATLEQKIDVAVQDGDIEPRQGCA